MTYALRRHAFSLVLPALIRVQPAAAPRTLLSHLSTSATSSRVLPLQRVAFRNVHSAIARQTFTRQRKWPRSVLILAVFAVPLSAAFTHAQAEEAATVPEATHTDNETPEEHEKIQEHEADLKNETLLWKCINFLNDWIWEPLLTTRRFIYLGIVFLPVLLTMPVLLLEKGNSHGKKDLNTTVWWYQFLVKQMERAGPTFIKLAQWAGSRRDLFPESLCVMFGRLHSNGKPHTLKHTKMQLEKSFGKPFEELFVDFEETPLGIGAVAQVYRATLQPDLIPSQYRSSKHKRDPSPSSRVGRTILPAPEDYAPASKPNEVLAIKILHPKVNKNIRRDLKIMAVLAGCLNVIPGVQWLSLPEEVAVFGDLMLSQLDLRTEARNLETFEHNFRHKRTISFPRPLSAYTTKEVLVEEYQDAVPLKHFLRVGGGPYDEVIANLGLDAFLKMLLIDNFVHSDLHPGNIMIKFYKPTTRSVYAHFFANLFDRPESEPAAQEPEPGQPTSVEIAHKLRSLSKDQDKWLAELNHLKEEGYQPELVFIDTGLVTELNDKNRKNFLELFSAIAQFDGYKAGQLMVERCRSPEAVIDEETFALKMQRLVLSVKSQTFSLGKIRIADVLSEVLSNVRNHHVKMEADFVNTVISVLLLEGIGRTLDPNMDLFANALPVLRQVGMQMQTSAIKDSGMDLHTLGSVAKIWIWMEARNLASMAISEVDDMVLLDDLTPNI